jgi:hypothetical protein
VNAGGVLLRGTGANQAEFWIVESSIQQSRVASTIGPAAGGMFAHTVKSGVIENANFMENQVVSAGHDAAGALMIDNFVGVGADTIAFLPIPLANPLQFTDNRVNNPTAQSLGTVLVPMAFWNANFSGLAEDNIFYLGANNFPPPLGTLTNRVVGGF